MSSKNNPKKVLIGKKIGMTQVYDDQNRLVPVTVLEAGPCPIVQVKNQKSEGYDAIQVGYGSQKEHRLTNSAKGHFKKADVSPVRELREFRTADDAGHKVGDLLTVAQFAAGETVDVIATTKGRGFQGVVKRHGFAGGPASHGSMFHRRGGSYGGCQWPGHVYKNRKMPGHMGDVRRTTQNLVIVKVIEDKNLILVKGSFPGAKGAVVMLRDAKKAKKKA